MCTRRLGRRRRLGRWWLLIGLALPAVAGGATVYETPQAFLARACAGLPAPSSDALWLTGAIAEGAERILGHPYPAARIKRWRCGARQILVLDEIGKDRPITAAFAVEDGRIVEAAVLVFRESRGWEIQRPAFIAQFDGARLDDNGALDKTIDNITGATLSVRAMRRMATLALWLAEQADAPP